MCFGGGSKSSPAPVPAPQVPPAPDGPNVISSEIVSGPDKIDPAPSNAQPAQPSSTTTSTTTGLSIPK